MSGSTEKRLQGLEQTVITMGDLVRAQQEHIEEHQAELADVCAGQQLDGELIDPVSRRGLLG
jgi:hypothetical protein